MFCGIGSIARLADSTLIKKSVSEKNDDSVLGFDVSADALLAPPDETQHAYTRYRFLGGDPAAGSPTATLLRLFPPYETQIRRSQERPRLTQGSLGWNDGRCVQGAGTYSPRASDTRLLGIPCS